jgi:hypothetical protein
MNRYTFVIQVHADGPATLENLSTHERVPVSDLTAVGSQIERWLAAVPSSLSSSGSAPEAEDQPPAAPRR